MKMNILSFVAVIGLLLCSFVSSEKGYNVGDEARDFSLKNVDGDIVSMSDYDDAEGIILIFTCNTCPYSKMYEQRIIELNDNYQPKGFPVLAVNSNDKLKSPGDTFEEMVKLAQSKGYKFPYLYDETQEIAKIYGATNTPHVYVLKKMNDRFNVAYIGAIDDNSRSAKAATRKYVEEAVDALLMNKFITTKMTKAIGCTIKWK